MAEGRSPGRRSVLLALAGVLGGAVTGCAHIPGTGPVRTGGAVEAEDERGYRVQPPGPVPGASPAELVLGFLLAGIGVDDDFEAAREFLSSARRSSWRPTARTAVHPVATLELQVGEATGQPAAGDDAAQATGVPDGASVPVRVGAPVLAEVDPTGRYRSAPVGERVDVVLTLVGEGGQWRISDAPDLLLLDESRFGRVFSLRAVAFTSRSSDALVPDPRWLLDRTAAATTLVEQVLEGPPAWLAPAVSSGAPSGTELPTGSVVVSAGTATVDLPASLQRERTSQLKELQRQVVATLGTLGSSATQVQVTLDGGELPSAGSATLDAGGGDGLPVVVADGAVQRLAGGQLVPVEGLPALPDPQDPAVLGDQLVVLVAGRTHVQRLVLGDGGEPAAAVPVGDELVPPSLDPLGWAWTTPASSAGTVTAVGPQGELVAVPAAWLAGRRVVGVRAAADGARLLVTSTGAAGQPDAVRVDVAAVSRSGSGTPQALTTDATPPTPWLAAAQGAVWLGSTSIAVLGAVVPGCAQAASATEATRAAAQAGAPAVWQIDGGRATDLGGPEPGAGAVRLAGATGTGRQSLLVGGADGRIWSREGSRWLALAGLVAQDPSYPG
ncbi:LpqB family beta-propeller domain-containing protein [Quadrisphaera sp. INWT6]|uniref:LpqB family beta-propeller domain-containing protein n=1 Tax=Quadrisphaera sp. INWT6 TaxID=2596917 RepID=UPI0018922C1C|nr:LpqB family beta-propeller domain-containing protein [Quadrisphaera sp. INWT6]MBF5081418.1 hypothetical protein [Quadrisphaera sp. INWT6]